MGNAAVPAFDIGARTRADAQVATRVAAIPWYVWCLAAAVTSDAMGGYWDISWHISIGRDTFWTPAHMMVYLAGILAGIASGYMILSTTFGSSQPAKDVSVSVWGFRGSLGAFVAAWGGIAMLTSAPFDNCWHNAYGLDVKIISLPHSILALGEFMITLGAILLICAHLNRASGAARDKLDRLLLYIGGIATFGAAMFVLESTWLGAMHSSMFYYSIAGAFPIVLLGISCISKSRWPMTTMAAIYMGLFIFFLWMYPLFPATPKLGPVYQHITHMVPLWFPMLLIFPAFALDLLREQYGEQWGSWHSAIIAGVVYLAVFIAAQWPFADFLMSPAARNWVFGTTYFGYNEPANLLYNPYVFNTHLDKTTAAFAYGMSAAFVKAIIACGIGLWLGNALRKVQR
jgi:hypothetical protein